jgi:6-phosphogluconolactonase
MKYISDPSQETLVGLCVASVIEAISSAWSERRPAHIVITGGRTGLSVARSIDSHLFALLRGNSVFEGSMLHIWFSDERFTAFDDVLRNDSTLISGFGLCKSHIVFHRVSEPGDLDEATIKYASEIDVELEGRPFDAVILSVGEDGHVASLFPGSVDSQDANSAVAVRESPKPPAQRISISLPRLSNSKNIYVFACGESKSEALATIDVGPVGLLDKISSAGQLNILTDLQIPGVE